MNILLAHWSGSIWRNATKKPSDWVLVNCLFCCCCCRSLMQLGVLLISVWNKYLVQLRGSWLRVLHCGAAPDGASCWWWCRLRTALWRADNRIGGNFQSRRTCYFFIWKVLFLRELFSSFLTHLSIPLVADFLHRILPFVSSVKWVIPIRSISIKTRGCAR